MFSIDNFRAFIEQTLNAQLPTAEQLTKPFRIFADIGEASASYRNLNTVYSNRYGVISVLASNNASINGLQIYNATVSVDILVNVDQSIHDPRANLGEYQPVIDMRALLDKVAAENSGVTKDFIIDRISYSVTSVFTLSTASTFEVDAGELGKVVPMTFSVDVSVVETGINSSAISITIDDEAVYASQIAEDMVASSEGQTRMGDSRSSFNVQEARYSLTFVMPLTSSDLSSRFLTAMHTGEISTPLSVVVKYGTKTDSPEYFHTMTISSVRLTAQIPNNAGLNIELIETDVL